MTAFELELILWLSELKLLLFLSGPRLADVKGVFNAIAFAMLFRCVCRDAIQGILILRDTTLRQYTETLCISLGLSFFRAQCSVPRFEHSRRS